MIQILQGDNVDHLRAMPEGCIQLCVTSPPYGQLRTYKGSLSWDFEGVAKELFRVLCVGGVLCWNVGDETVDGSEACIPERQKLYFRDEAGFAAHDTMIWEKSNFSNPESVRYHQLFEFIYVLSKGKPATWSPIKDKANATAGRIGALGTNSYTKRDGSKSTRTTYLTKDFGMRGNVWRGNTRGQEEFCQTKAHPAMMPRWLARDLILSWSNPGDTVLDCFAGSGTTGEEALKLGRKAILIEKEPEYAQLSRDNCNATTPGFALI
jgi:DNA modification methylase